MVRFTGADSDLMISRDHCELVMDPPNFHLRDLGSRNGTYLNGKRIDGNSSQHENSMAVQDGDIITLGGTTFRIALIDLPDLSDAESIDGLAEEPGTKQDCLVAC